MTTNDVLRSLRYMMKYSNAKVAEVCGLGGYIVMKNEIHDVMRPEEDPEFLACPDEVVAYFLDGLIYEKRGRDENRPRPPLEIPISNNLVIKKLRVAFELREDDILQLMQTATFKFGKAELSAILRKRDHQNYRECGDQALRYFLKGLTARLGNTAKAVDPAKTKEGEE
ncbi:DUF1456 family protein [soil metagenome]